MSMRVQNIISVIVIAIVAWIILDSFSKVGLILTIFGMALMQWARHRMAEETDQRLRDAGIEPTEFHRRPLSKEAPYF